MDKRLWSPPGSEVLTTENTSECFVELTEKSLLTAICRERSNELKESKKELQKLIGRKKENQKTLYSSVESRKLKLHIDVMGEAFLQIFPRVACYVRIKLRNRGSPIRMFFDYEG